jgi:hypothetical protein
VCRPRGGEGKVGHLRRQGAEDVTSAIGETRRQDQDAHPAHGTTERGRAGVQSRR